MAELLPDVLRHLEALVGFDTRNPPRNIGTGGIFDYLRSQLPDFQIEVTDHGAGAVSLLAVRGSPRRVFNVHLDTVPSSQAWSADPHTLRITGERAIGLGACDIKGAAAGLVAAANATTGDAAFLFSSDEEANDPRCVAAFLEKHARAGANAITASALHQAVRWGGHALGLVEAESYARFGGLTGLRFNIGRIEGGIKANMIAPSAELRFGFRPLPSHDIDVLHARFRECAEGPVQYEETFRGPSLPSADVAAAEERRLAARDLADAMQLPIGSAVDFWTEASLFSQAGLTTFVYGPGDIAQAHTADEWVALEQLQRYAASITRILGNTTT